MDDDNPHQQNSTEPPQRLDAPLLQRNKQSRERAKDAVKNDPIDSQFLRSKKIKGNDRTLPQLSPQQTLSSKLSEQPKMVQKSNERKRTEETNDATPPLTLDTLLESAIVKVYRINFTTIIIILPYIYFLFSAGT